MLSLKLKLKLKWISRLVLVLLLLAFYPFVTYGQSVLVYGHRGAAGIEPENTLPAFKKALALGVDYIDMDVGMSRDGVVVVTHDLSLNPAFTKNKNNHYIKNHQLYIHNLTYKQIRSYDVGVLNKHTPYAQSFLEQKAVPNTHIPRLIDILSYAKNKTNNTIHYQIEIKTDPMQADKTASPQQIARAVVDIVKKVGVEDKVEIHSFDWRAVIAVHQYDPNIATSYLTDNKWFEQEKRKNPKLAMRWHAGYKLHTYPSATAQLLNVLGAKVWCANYQDIDAKDIKYAHDNHLKMVVWTVDKPKDMKKMLALGVDGIITNRPDLLLLLIHS